MPHSKTKTSKVKFQPKTGVHVNFKAPVTAPRYHYVCPECGRKYFSKVEKNGHCKYCSSNPRLKVNLRRRKEKASLDEVNMDLATFGRPSRGRGPVSYTYQRPVFDDDDDDDDDEEMDNVDDDLDDTDYEPPARDPFNIGMRLTGGPGRMRDGLRDPRNVVVDPSCDKLVTAQIGGKANRPTTTGAAMGVAIKGKGTISASKVAQRGGKYYLGGKLHQEWCHILGDSLGGPTADANLVAGSFGSNTYMCALEKLLIGRTALQIIAKAACSRPHVAEFIYYRVALASNPNKFIDFLIDATNDHFTKEDLNDEQATLIAWLKSVGQVV